MGDLFLATQGKPAAPSANSLIVYPDSSTKQLTIEDDTGKCLSLGSAIRAQAVADVVANAADTYLIGVPVPQHLLQVGTIVRFRAWVTKTAAGVAAPIWSLRVGVNGTVADAARLTLASVAQTAVVDTACVEVFAVVRSIGAAGVIAGGLTLTHNLDATGFAVIGTPTLQAVSAGFDTTVAGLKIGLSVNPGAAGVWTHQIVAAELLNV